MNATITSGHPLTGNIALQGDKSISHRAVMFSALADGVSEIEGLSLGEDVRSTISCLKQLGIIINSTDGVVKVYGKGLLGLKPPDRVLDAGNSGTTMRLLSGVLAGQNFASEITGDASLRKRPMKRVIEPLQQMGADISGCDGQYAPLTINGKMLSNTEHRLKIASAQVKSCLLLAGMYCQGMTKIIEPFKTRDHSERMLSYIGANISIHENIIQIEGLPQLLAASIYVPGDISSAAFFVVAALLVGQSNLTIKDVGINPTRTGLVDVLSQMGASIAFSDKRTRNYETMADLNVASSKLKGMTISGGIIPRIIDELPILAVAATQAKGVTVIKDASELRVKETDRIRATVENLRRMGAQVEEKPDGMIIQGKQKLHGAVVDSFDDHRIAMAFAIAGLLAEGETEIRNIDCVDISFPGFFHQLEELCYD
ncbi:3-phosphoshikimate 1-carboxyvinyltransferase [candidate division KSB1 bacterium]|nr:3-phosphoshikimate 1-carboxyvinyltransferase [candidate division KSB1 bacterium]